MASVSRPLEIYDELKRQILANALPPGKRLRIKDLADSFSTSPTPVREALRALERDGLIVITPNVGAEVAPFGVQEVREHFFVRSHLEALAAEMAAAHLTAEDFQKLDRLIGDQHAADRERDGVRFAALNRDFHETIYAVIPNRLLYRLIFDLWVGNRFRVVFSLNPVKMRESIDEHREILKALRERDGARARELTLQHKLNTATAVTKLLEMESAFAERPLDGSNR
jgi:DNA-binding GntR family transcriptional regulator